MRRGGSSPFANPVLIGAVTVLVVTVAVFLAYNANSGLPFVPTYQINVDVPDAAALVKGNEVRIGGARVGAISSITPVTARNGSVHARLALKLDKTADPLPKDSTIVIRPKSPLGQKYVEVTPGRSKEGWKAGDTIPTSASKPAEVEIDQVFDIFDKPTREGITKSTLGFGTALAGRGESLNEAIGSFRPLLTDLLPVAQYLRTDKTDLTGFIQGISQAAAEVAPVAQQQADLFKGLDQTFGALSQVTRPIQDTISEGPATLDASVRSFRIQRPFLANTTRLMQDLQPGVRALRQGAPTLSDALRIGRPVLLRTPALDRRLERVLVSLRRFAEDDVVPRGVADLTDTTRSLRPTLHFLTPAQTTCNYVADLFRNGSDVLSLQQGSGTTQRFVVIAAPEGKNNEGSPSTAPANGKTTDNHVHINPYPYTASPGQPKECEAGNEIYEAGKTVIGNTPGKEPAKTDVKK